MNNGHRRASSPQPPIGPMQATAVAAAAANQARAGAAAGTGCRGRPPKIRKEIPIQSTVINECSQDFHSLIHLFRISMKFLQHK